MKKPDTHRQTPIRDLKNDPHRHQNMQIGGLKSRINPRQDERSEQVHQQEVEQLRNALCEAIEEN